MSLPLPIGRAGRRPRAAGRLGLDLQRRWHHFFGTPMMRFRLRHAVQGGEPLCGPRVPLPRKGVSGDILRRCGRGGRWHRSGSWPTLRMDALAAARYSDSDHFLNQLPAVTGASHPSFAHSLNLPASLTIRRLYVERWNRTLKESSRLRDLRVFRPSRRGATRPSPSSSNATTSRPTGAFRKAATLSHASSLISNARLYELPAMLAN